MVNLYIKVELSMRGETTVIYEQDISESDSIEAATRRFAKKAQRAFKGNLADEVSIKIRERIK